MAASSEEASANVQHVAAATGEMAETIANIGRQVEETADMAREAVRKVELSDDRMAGLASAAERIGSVVELIARIARQINLLALNATIEAARAGEFGKGFAVVAQEVKEARQAAHATVEITEHIDGIQAATTESVCAVGEIGVIIGRISEIAKSVVSSVEEQEATSKGIAFNVQGAASRTAEVAVRAREVTKGANETGGASLQVLTSAKLLSKESSRLKSELDSFLGGIQAA